jgi:DNA-binding MarR family transcriptional regulator
MPSVTPPSTVDPIREAVRNWQAHGFGMLAHMEATTSIMRLQQILSAQIEQALKGFNVTFAQYEALVLLHFSRDGALPLGRMGRRLMVHPATVTSTIDQLETKGLVKRKRNQVDRRVILACLTHAGRNTAIEATEVLVAARFGLEAMTESDAAALASVIGAYRDRIGDRV